MKSGSANPPFFFIFKIFLDILGLMLFHIDLRVSLSVFLKKNPTKLTGILIGILLNLAQLEKIDILTILNF